MTDYISRYTSFIVSSIQTIKGRSGGQRWNEICMDCAALYGLKKFTNDSFTSQELYDFLWEPTLTESLKEKLKDKEFREFMMIILHALLDPPSSWWLQKSNELPGTI